MTGDEMRDVRACLGLSRVQFGNAIGYGGNYNTVDTTVKRYESGRNPIPPWIATRVRAMDQDGLMEFIRHCNAERIVDRAEFVRRLTGYLLERAA